MKEKIIKIWNELLWLLPKKIAHKILYRKVMHESLDLKNPKDINQKLHYLMVYKYGKKEAELADKHRVKEYVKNLNIKNLQIPKTIETYKNANSIDIEKLPDKFVLKCNHGSGDVFICTNKKEFNLVKAKRTLNKCLRENFAKNNLEYHYKYIHPVIIAEEYLDDKKSKNPIDYKFFCFSGRVDSILVCSNRSSGLNRTVYDTNWNNLYYFKDSNPEITKPKKLQEMVKIAEELSKDFGFARIDLYEINENIYFGEYTFTPAAGFLSGYKKEVLEKWGDKLDLSLYEYRS